MMLLIPAVAPKAVAEKERNVMVTIVDAPPPPPPAARRRRRILPPPPVKNLSPPKPSPVPPPPQAPVVACRAAPNDIVTAVAAGTAGTADLDQASVDISSKAMNPPRYRRQPSRAGIQGEVILIIDVDASGSVTNVTVEKSSRNATWTVLRWKRLASGASTPLKQAVEDGRSRSRSVNFALN